MNLINSDRALRYLALALVLPCGSNAPQTRAVTLASGLDTRRLPLHVMPSAEPNNYFYSRKGTSTSSVRYIMWELPCYKL